MVGLLADGYKDRPILNLYYYFVSDVDSSGLLHSRPQQEIGI